MDIPKPATADTSESKEQDRASSHDRDKEREKPRGFLDFLRPLRHDAPSEEELLDLMDENADIQEDEKRMIRDILGLADMAVREIMTPRVDMMLVEDCESCRVALERMRGTGYSRLPVYHDDIDGIVGIVHYKDLVGPLMDGRDDEPVTKYMYDALFVPETKDVVPLLGEMQEQRQQMAIVVDEYGGTDGLITVEDILEEIVGEIMDETDADDEMITLVAAGVWRVDGRFPTDDAIELGWPVTDSDDYETIAGWLLAALDCVPKPGDELEIGGYQFRIERMRRRRISIVRVLKL